MDGIKEGGGWLEMPLPLAEKIAKFVATSYLIFEHPEGEAFLPEMKIWLDDPEIKKWTEYMSRRALARDGKEVDAKVREIVRTR